MGKLLEELNRRKVFRVAAIYAVVAWGLIQVADTIAPMMNLPESAPRLVLFLLIILFPIAVFLAWAYEVTPEGIKPDFTAQAVPVATNNTDRKLIYAILGLVLLVVGFQLSDRFLFSNITTAPLTAAPISTTADSPVLRASIILNQSLPRFPGIGLRTHLTLAPDGTTLTYLDFESGKAFLRDLATRQTQEIFSDLAFHRLSPNGDQLLTFNPLTGEIGVMPSQGGGLRSLPIQSLGPPGWLSDEALIYSHVDGMKIFSLTDGTDELLPGFDNSTPAGLSFPLPNDSAFLFTQPGSAELPNNASILAYNLSNQSTKTIIIGGYYPQYVSSGHIIFIRGGDLWAVPFDPDAIEVTGTEALVLEGIDSIQSFGVANYTVSDYGRLVYLPGREYVPNRTTLFWADRMGNRTELRLRAGTYEEPRLSPNGELLALTSLQPDGSTDIWIHDFSSETFAPVTFSGSARSPVWTPDGSQLVYQLNTVGSEVLAPRGELWIMNANGTGQAERILDAPAKADSFSPIDEKLIYFVGGTGGSPINLETLSYSDDAWVSDPLFPTEHATWGARVSPDGRWIAYGSNESGIMQIYVQPYPNLDGGRWQISSNEIASREPSWGPNSDELFYVRLDGSLMRTEITIEGDRFAYGPAQQLLTDVRTAGSSPTYAVSNDGERFLHFYSPIGEQNTGIDQDHSELIVVENWFEELNRLAPPDS